MKTITEEKHLPRISIHLLQPTEYKLTRRRKPGVESQESSPALQRKVEHICKQVGLLRQLLSCNSVSNMFKGKKWYNVRLHTPILQVPLQDTSAEAEGSSCGQSTKGKEPPRSHLTTKKEWRKGRRPRHARFSTYTSWG